MTILVSQYPWPKLSNMSVFGCVIVVVMCSGTLSPVDSSPDDSITNLVSSMINVLRILEVKHILVFYDISTEPFVFNMYKQLEDDGCYNMTFMMYDLSYHGEYNCTNSHKFFSQIYKHNDNTPPDNILIILSLGCTNGEDYFDKARTLDCALAALSDGIYQSKAKMFLVSSCNKLLNCIFSETYIKRFPNIAIFYYDNSRDSNGSFPLIATKDGPFKIVSRDVISVNTIFPNYQYKMNRQSVNVSIHPEAVIRLNLLEVLSRYLNFSYNIIPPPDGFYGSYKNGTWNGMVGQLVRSEVSIVYDILSITKERLEAVDFVSPVLDDNPLGILFKNERSDNKSWFLYLKPLNSQVYYLIFVSCVIVSGVLAVCAAIDSTADADRLIYGNIYNSVFFTMGCLFLEGGHVTYRTQSARILFASWWIFCVVCAAVYMGRLTSTLIPKETQPFKSIQELVTLSDWKFGTFGQSADEDIFRFSRKSDVQLLWKSIVKFNETDPSILSDSLEVQMNKVRAGKYGLFTSGGLRNFKMEQDCSIEYKNDLGLPSIRQTLAVSKGNALRFDLQYIMLRVDNIGILERLVDPKSTRPKHCTIYDESTQPLLVENVKGLFAIVVIGTTAASIILVLEKMYAMFRNKRK